MKKIALTILTIFILQSCAQKKNSNGILGKIFSGEIFSTRQIGTTTYVGLVQLKSEALLRSADIVDGKAVIEDEKRDALIAEQDEVIQKLTALSPEIKIIARYKLVLNAIAFTAPSGLAGEIGKITGVMRVVENTQFARPKLMSTEQKVQALTKNLNKKTSVMFIGADKLIAQGINGNGMKVGIIDTGIDYTHKMFGGPGTPESYKSINPDLPNSLFPNDKVVGGVDFVGTNFNSASPEIKNQIPQRDDNPLDEAEHGTHVSGTVAGIGDGLNTYSGVAPEAKLYGLKVFGKKGSTSDIAVIQALEYAADITEQADPTNHLDVVNLSLGGGYGKPKILYSEAVHNLTRAGTVVVASAGNSGDEPYIVGAPSTAEDAISVAASIDDLDQNVLFNAVQFKIGDQLKLSDLVEGDMTVPAHTSNVSGSLVYIGNTADDISPELKKKVAGKIALIDRGGEKNGVKSSFASKMQVASDLGAIGVVVANNQEGESIAMGGEGKFTFPAVMISKALGDEIKNVLKTGDVTINFTTNESVRHDERIDQITSFSSRGPRSLDSLIKPEISGPGSNIISAHAGTGFEGVQFSGTSMSGPHMAGVMTLLKQAFPDLSVAELKAKVMNTAKILTKNGEYVPVSLQGSGRVQTFEAFKSKLVATPYALSLGEISVGGVKALPRTVTIKNISSEDIVVTTKVVKGKNVAVGLPGAFKVKANSSVDVPVRFVFSNKAVDESKIESDGFIIFTMPTGESVHVPFLGIMNRVSAISGSEFTTLTDSNEDRLGAEVDLKLKNEGKNSGAAMIFNMIGSSPRKVQKENNLSSNTTCDLESAGMRILTKNEKGHDIKVLQVGVKLFDMLTMWQPCDVSMQIDSDGDGVADLELVGSIASYIPGVSSKVLASVLLDAKMAKDLRKNYEMDVKTNNENYGPAIIDARPMVFFDHSSVALIEVDLSKIPTARDGSVGIKLAVSNIESDSGDSDDFLANHAKEWQKIILKEEAFGYLGIPEVVTLEPQSEQTVVMKRGNGNQRLLALFPQNVPVGEVGFDHQSQVFSEKLLTAK
jgi:minor extracellular serine protease Vpr